MHESECALVSQWVLHVLQKPSSKQAGLELFVDAQLLFRQQWQDLLQNFVGLRCPVDNQIIHFETKHHYLEEAVGIVTSGNLSCNLSHNFIVLLQHKLQETLRGVTTLKLLNLYLI